MHRRAAIEMNPAAAISARNTRRRMAKRCATMKITRTWRPGSIAAYGNQPELYKEPLEFEYVHPSQRSYK